MPARNRLLRLSRTWSRVLLWPLMAAFHYLGAEQ
jgi:hypothetical protein